MRSSSYLSLAAAAIFLLVLSRAMEAEAIRLDAGTRASVSGSQTAIDKPKTSDNNVAKDSAISVSDTTRSAAVAEEVRAVAHKLPEFHEDYYGPSDHSPRHH